MEILTKENYDDLNSAEEFIEDLKSNFTLSGETEAKLKRAFIEYKSGADKEIAKEALLELIAEVKKENEESETP